MGQKKGCACDCHLKRTVNVPYLFKNNKLFF